MMAKAPRVAILWRGGPAERARQTLAGSRFAAMGEALATAGLLPEACIYAEEMEHVAEAQLADAAAVLVWVNPIHDDRDRTALDVMLARVAARGVLVSAHPDAILAMGTKEVLHRTRAMGWGSDTRLYTSLDGMRSVLPQQLAAAGPLVLKQNRGHSGIGVWRVERAAGDASVGLDMPVQVREAPRGSTETVLPLWAFIDACTVYFANGGCMLEQPYVARLPEGMTRCYMVGESLGGFGHQAVVALYPAPPGALAEAAPPPGPRLYSGPDDPRFQDLRQQMEQGWVTDMRAILGLSADALPVLWDADFLLGPKDARGRDSYVLCEINVSSVYPFPESALRPIASLLAARLAG